jgi:peptidyl-tRNA hydrolase
MVSTKRKRTAVRRREEKRFYVIVPEKVARGDEGTHRMEPGRLIAQGFHLGCVVARARLSLGVNDADITTIVLGARNSKEMDKLLGALRMDGVHFAKVAWYKDHNPEVYETEERVLTAICLGPVEKSKVDHLIGHLELY